MENVLNFNLGPISKVCMCVAVCTCINVLSCTVKIYSNLYSMYVIRGCVCVCVIFFKTENNFCMPDV